MTILNNISSSLYRAHDLDIAVLSKKEFLTNTKYHLKTLVFYNTLAKTLEKFYAPAHIKDTLILEETDIKNIIDDYSTHIVVATIADDLVGITFLNINKTTVHLYNFFVEEGSRKLGIGRKIIEKIKVIGKNKEISLNVQPTNVAAVNFYNQVGFETLYYQMIIPK